MGSGKWDSKAYAAASTVRSTKGLSDFAYHDAVQTGRAKGIHPDLDPKRLAGPTSPHAGKVIRESRDNDEHPNSLPIAIVFDVTGSMGGIPRDLQKKLTSLMDVVIEKAGVEDPQVLVGAVGDSRAHDRYPFQIGQFESDNRFDEALRNIILEGGGGGQNMESYGLAYYFAGKHMVSDSFEKRGKKGYFITMGDELPWPTLTAEEITKIFDLPSQTDLSIEELIEAAKEKWELYHLFCLDGSYANNTAMHDEWRRLLGERVIFIDDSSMVCEIVAGIVHMNESALDVNTVISDIGLTGNDAKVVASALSSITSSTTGTAPEPTDTGGVEAL